MRRHFEREIENLKKALLKVGALVEESVARAIKALSERNREEADWVFKTDDEIDERELRIEEECLKVLALYQPVASDLRFIVAVVKINSDLERMGDLAVNIAERAVYLAEHPDIGIPEPLLALSEHARVMVKKSLDAFIGQDTDLALRVTRMDAQADDMHVQVIGQLQEGMIAQPDRIDRLLMLLSSSRNLERIADHATNVAEDVYYMVKGDIIRHRTREFDEKESRSGP